jgi:membrane associated rhomboid family serine protease
MLHLSFSLALLWSTLQGPAMEQALGSTRFLVQMLTLGVLINLLFAGVAVSRASG